MTENSRRVWKDCDGEELAFEPLPSWDVVSINFLSKSFWMEREQWQEIREHVDGLFKALEEDESNDT